MYPPVKATLKSIGTTPDTGGHIIITPDTTQNPLSDSHTRTKLMFGLLIFFLWTFFCIIIYMIIKHCMKKKTAAAADDNQNKIIVVNVGQQQQELASENLTPKRKGNRRSPNTAGSWTNSSQGSGDIMYNEEEWNDNGQQPRMKKRAHSRPKKRTSLTPKRKSTIVDTPEVKKTSAIERYMKMTACLGQSKKTMGTGSPLDESSTTRTKSPGSKSPEGKSIAPELKKKSGSKRN